MVNIVFDGGVLFSHHFSGKFQSPTNEWMHLTRNLTDFELMVVTDGTLYIADHKNEYTVNESEYLLMPPTPHQHGYKQGGCSFYWLHFHCSTEHMILEDSELTFENQKIYVPLTGKLSSPERVIILMKQLQDSDRRYRNIPLNDSIATAILSEIGCQNVHYKKHGNSNQTTQIFNDIADYVHYHAHGNLTVKDVADYFNYNPKYISSFFKNQSGTSLKQYILQSKMDFAKAELSDTNHSISQIAFNVGFNDPHNFTNAFKKITGMSPTEYRQSYDKRALYYS